MYQGEYYDWGGKFINTKDLENKILFSSIKNNDPK